jgi:hypothetical protein
MNLKNENIKEIVFNKNYGVDSNNNEDSNEEIEEVINDVEDENNNTEDQNNNTENQNNNTEDQNNENNEVLMENNSLNEINNISEKENENNSEDSSSEENESNLNQENVRENNLNFQNTEDSYKIIDLNKNNRSKNVYNEDNNSISEENNSNNESTVKSIYFSNIENNNIENVVFNNVGEDNISKFISENKNITVEEEVAIRDESILYKDDIVYLKELENQLLSEYPIDKQSLKFIQKEVEEVAKKIIEVKNIGIRENIMIENGIEYKLINDIINNNFNSSWVIPIVLDKHRIYTKLKEDSNDSSDDKDSNIYFSESLENKEGIIEENQKVQMINLKKYLHDYRLSKLDIKTYLNDIENITKPYLTKYVNSNIGIIRKPLNDSLVLRYSDLRSVNWNTHMANSDHLISVDTFDETGKIKGIKDNVFIKGDELNIIGFMLLNHNLDDNNIYISKNDPRFLTKNFKKIGIIQKIYNSGDSIILDIPDHGLSNDETIYIEESNSFPKINSTFHNSVNIVNNNTIELKSSVKFIQDGNYGILYALTKLEFDLYGITKQEDDIQTYFKESNYKDGQSNNHNKIYLFDNIIIDEDDYDKIIKKIMPTLNDIIKNEYDKLSSAYSYSDINEIIRNYSLTLNSFHIEQASKLKYILENNLLKINSESNELVKLNFNKNSKKLFKNDNYFLSDKFITDSNIVKIYGHYRHLNKPEDNIGLRLRWLESQKDNGLIYYLNYVKNIKSNNITDYVKNKITQLEKIYKDIDKNFQKEKKINNKKSNKIYRYQAYIVTDDDKEAGFKNLKKTLLDNTVVFYDNNIFLWKNEKMVPFTDLEDNTITLVGNDIWVWQKGSWTKSDAVSKYNNIQHLCELNNLDLSNVTLDSLECIYRKDYGCDSKLYIRYEENIKKILEDLEKLKKLDDYIQNNKDTYNIDKQINDLILKFYSVSITNIEINDDLTSDVTSDDIIQENIVVEPVDQLSVLLKLISKIKNNDLKLEYIYNIIDKDGILINNSIYSKKYKRNMNICGHYIYFKKINYADNPDEKVELIKNMLNTFSDDGEHEKNVHTCKYCGEFLAMNDYDDTEGFNENGMIKKSREVWTLDPVKKTESLNLFEIVKLTNMTDIEFKEVLLKSGLSIDDVDDALSISTFITKNLCAKTGVELPNNEIINIIIDSMQKIKNIIPYRIYRITKIKELKEKGFSDLDIERVESKNTFKEGHERYVKIKKNSIISARFLIAVQTIVPTLSKTSKSSICPFYSFNDKEGIEYMSCILDEMKVVFLKDKTKSLEILTVSIEESINDYKQMPHIRQAFIEKRNYDLEIEKRKAEYKFKTNNEINNNLIEPVEIGDEFNTIIKNSKNSDSIHKLKSILENRLLYLAKNIKKVTKQVIEQSSLTNAYIGELESSCCTEDADKYLNYYYYIETESSYPIKKNIDESISIYSLTNYFINIGSIHKFMLYDPTRFTGIENNPIIDNERNSSEYLIRSVFEIYVDTGIYAGTLREYIGGVDDLVDIKSGKTKKEIMSKIYSISEYDELLKNIEKHNTKFYITDKNTVFEKDRLNEMKKDSINKLDIEINKLVKNVAIVLNKDKNFITKYVDLFRNFGIFIKNINDVESSKEKIKSDELMYKNRLNYTKNFFITKLRKYLSIIKNDRNKIDNNIQLDFIGKDPILDDIQQVIYDENKKLLYFFNEEVRKDFVDLHIDFTNEEINSINATDNIYDSKYEKIKIYSDFNFNDASKVMLHILVSQLNRFIICKLDSYKDTDLNENIFNSSELFAKDIKNNQCKHICEFIMILFEELENDYEMFELCKDGSESIKNSLIHDIIEYKSKIQYSDIDDDYFTGMMKSKLSKPLSAINYLDEKIEMEENNDEANGDADYLEKMDQIMEKGKKELFDKLGYEPTDDQLETYKEDYLSSKYEDEVLEDEAYNLDSTAKGKEVIDQGAGYGEFSDFDFETGDGFDYSEEMTE